MKNSIKTFFADVKNEADKQKADEQAAKENRKRVRAEKKAARQQDKTSKPEVMEPPAEDFINSIVPDITFDTTTDESQNPEESLDEVLEEIYLGHDCFHFSHFCVWQNGIKWLGCHHSSIRRLLSI